MNDVKKSKVKTFNPSVLAISLWVNTGVSLFQSVRIFIPFFSDFEK